MIKNLELKFNSSLVLFKQKCAEIEQKTLWKIKDLEELINGRVSMEYVDTLTKSLEV